MDTAVKIIKTITKTIYKLLILYIVFSILCLFFTAIDKISPISVAVYIAFAVGILIYLYKKIASDTYTKKQPVLTIMIILIISFILVFMMTVISKNVLSYGLSEPVNQESDTSVKSGTIITDYAHEKPSYAIFSNNFDEDITVECSKNGKNLIEFYLNKGDSIKLDMPFATAEVYITSASGNKYKLKLLLIAGLYKTAYNAPGNNGIFQQTDRYENIGPFCYFCAEIICSFSIKTMQISLLFCRFLLEYIVLIWYNMTIYLGRVCHESTRGYS